MVTTTSLRDGLVRVAAAALSTPGFLDPDPGRHHWCWCPADGGDPHPHVVMPEDPDITCPPRRVGWAVRWDAIGGGWAVISPRGVVVGPPTSPRGLICWFSDAREARLTAHRWAAAELPRANR